MKQNRYVKFRNRQGAEGLLLSGNLTGIITSTQPYRQITARDKAKRYGDDVYFSN